MYTTQFPRSGLEPGTPNLELSALTMMPPCCPRNLQLIVKKKSRTYLEKQNLFSLTLKKRFLYGVVILIQITSVVIKDYEDATLTLTLI